MIDCMVTGNMPTIGSMVGCIAEAAFGNMVFAAVCFFVMILFLMWKLGANWQVTVVASVALTFVFLWWTAVWIFATLLWFAIVAAGILVVIAIFRFTQT